MRIDKAIYRAESGQSGAALAGLFRALLLVLALGVPLRLSAQGGEVRGSVRASRGGSTAAALVTLQAAGDSTVLRRAEAGPQAQFRFTGLAPGRYRLRVEQLGFHPADTLVSVGSAPVVLPIVLQEQAISLSGVLVEAERARTRFEETAGVTATGLRGDELRLLPGLAEADVLRAVEILPGVVSTSDYSSAYNVRGGSADQNLILLDGIPVYNPFHLGGLFSVFNADMIARAELLAGGFPAQHGGRVSSVLQIESDAGPGGFNGSAGVSLLATRVALGTSLPARQAAALGLRDVRGRISVRRSYFDQLLGSFFEFPYHLTDLQGFGEAWTRGGARAQVTGYSGRDVLDFTGVDDFPLKIRWDWGNDVAGIGWTRPFRAGQSLDTRLGVSRFATAIRFPEFQDTEFRSEITQLLLRTDYERPLAGESSFRAGYELDRLRYDNYAATGGTVFRQGSDRGWLQAGYAQVSWRPEAWLLEAGGRIDVWNPSSRGALAFASPRLAVKRFLGEDAALKVAAGRYTQFVHSLRDEELPLGIDIWVVSGARAPVVVSDQVQGGVEAFAGEWQLALEGYYRHFDGVTAQNGADDPNTDTDDLLTGTGSSWGADLLVRREAGAVRPMLAVSWLRARRTFADPLSGEEEPSRVTYAPVFDRRLDVDLTVNADVGRGVQLGMRFNYGSGLPYTRPLGAYIYQGFQPLDGTRTPTAGDADSAGVAVRLGGRNAERYPAYLRVDASVRRRWLKSWGTITPHLDVLNMTDRRNVLFYFYEYERRPARRSGVSMFPLLPTIGVEVTF